MNADNCSPMNADGFMNSSAAMVTWTPAFDIAPAFDPGLGVSAFIGVTSAFIGVSKDFRPHHSPPSPR